MTARSIATLALRIFGLFIAFQGLVGILQVIEAAGLGRAGVLEVLRHFGTITHALSIALGLLIWAYADRLAGRALGKEDSDTQDLESGPGAGRSRPGLSGLEVHAIALSVLGAFLLAQGIFRATRVVVTWLEAGRLNMRGAVTFEGFGLRAVLLASATYIVLGLVLMLGAQRVARAVQRSWWERRGVAREIES